MSKDAKLEIEERNQGGYQLRWFFEDGVGAALGEIEYADSDLGCIGEDWEHVAASLAAAKTHGVRRTIQDGYVWDGERDAKAALKAVRAAIKRKDSKPWPDWAVKAKSAGWAPPKGWKP